MSTTFQVSTTTHPNDVVVRTSHEFHGIPENTKVIIRAFEIGSDGKYKKTAKGEYIQNIPSQVIYYLDPRADPRYINLIPKNPYGEDGELVCCQMAEDGYPVLDSENKTIPLAKEDIRWECRPQIVFELKNY